MKTNRKLLSCLIAVGLLFGSTHVSFAAKSAKLNAVSAEPPETLVSPCGQTQTLGGDFGVNANGEIVYYAICKGSPGQLVIYNVDTQTLEDILPIEVNGVALSSSYGGDIGPDGKMYIAGASEFFIFDPATKTFSTLSVPVSSSGVMNRGDFDGDGNYYYGTYPTASLIQYNQKTKSLVNLGDGMVKGQYIRAVAAYEDKVFVASMGDPKGTEILSYNVKTGEKHLVPLPEYNGISGEEVTTVYTISLLGGKYMSAKASYPNEGYVQCVMDMETETWVDTFKGANHMHLSELVDGVTYYPSQNQLMSRNIFTKETKVYENIELSGSINMSVPKIVTLKNQEKYPGKSLIANSNTNGLVIVNFETGSCEYFYDGWPVLAAGMRLFEVGYNGDVVCSAMQGSADYVYNIYTGQIRSYPGAQRESILMTDGKYYLGSYGLGGGLLEFDPNKPGVKDVNPGLVSYLADAPVKQDRIFAQWDTGDKIYYGSVPYYGYKGGCVGEYDKTTKETRTFGNIVENQSVVGVTYLNGKVYGSTTVFNSLGTDTENDTAHVFRLDPATGEVELKVPLKLKNDLSNQLFAGEMTVSPDGKRLFVATNNTFVEIDPEDLSVKGEILIGSQNDMTIADTRWQGYFLEWAPNGLLFTNIGRITSAIDIDTMEHKVLYSGRTMILSLGLDDHLYTFADGNASIARMKLKGLNTPRDKYILNNAFMLKVGSEKAFYFGAEKQIDPANDQVKALVVDGRTLVPVRFLAENYGAVVGWDDATQTVTLTLGTKNVTIKLGEQKINVNGQEIKIDVPAQTIEERTMLPLRAFVENVMEKTVHYDAANELIVLPGYGLTVDETKDAEAFTKINELF